MNDNSVQFGPAVRWLLVLTASFLVFLPLHESLSIYGEWYTLGVPFLALALKIGYMSPDSPRGFHLQFHPFIVLNAAVWVGAFFGFRRAVKAGILSRRPALVVALCAFVIAGAWFAFGAVSVITALVHEY